jgi:hypothetical protein
MKIFPLIIITISFLIILTIYNFCLYKLLTNEDFGHQYYLILIYFICEIFSFAFHFFSNKKEIIIGDINPYIVTTEMNVSYSISDISNNNMSNINISNVRNNSDNSYITMSSNNMTLNTSIGSQVSTIPFVGIKCISFVLTGFLDFLSKIFIYNAIKYMYHDSIFRSIAELSIITLGNFMIIKLKKSVYYYSIVGLVIIIIYLLIFVITRSLKGNIAGTLLLVEGGILNSIQYIIQCKFFTKGEQYVYRIVSWEGLFGAIFSFLTLIITSLISCPFDQEKNKSDNNNNYFFYSFCNGNKLEGNLIVFFSDVKNNLGWFIFYFLSCILYSFLSVFIMKYINVIYRVSLDSFRMLFFIIIMLIVNK